MFLTSTAYIFKHTGISVFINYSEISLLSFLKESKVKNVIPLCNVIVAINFVNSGSVSAVNE
jgi:hypothetical protein